MGQPSELKSKSWSWYLVFAEALAAEATIAPEKQLIAIKTAKKSASNLRENYLAFTNFYLHSFTIFTKNGCVHAPSHPLTIGQSDIQDEGIAAGRHTL